MTLWEKTQKELKKRINIQSYETWLEPTSQISLTNKAFKSWIEKTYLDQIEEVLSQMNAEQTNIQFVYESNKVSSDENVVSKQSGDEIKLNPSYTFDRFVIGPSNSFSHAAAKAVSESPFDSYNPLFIYGDVGLGKTHLVHAIGHSILGRSKDIKLRYITSEKFMNELINAIRYSNTHEFREKYRNIDVLLIDDIQFIAGKDQTEEEFFHTFNSLYEAQKQITITSDCPPKEIPILEERLRSRFEWGLIADIKPPDLEMKMAILKKKAEIQGYPDFPNDVCMFIANKTKSNIRELEGSLTRLLAFASLSDREISIELAKEVLHDVIPVEDKKVSIQDIQNLVADFYDTSVKKLKSKDNSRAVANPRHVAMYLSRELTDESFPSIGKEFDKDHSSVVYAHKKVSKKIEENPSFNNEINSLIESLK